MKKHDITYDIFLLNIYYIIIILFVFWIFTNQHAFQAFLKAET